MDAEKRCVPEEKQAAARERVVENLRLAQRIARRYFRHDSARDEDLVQVAYVGLVKAAQRFDPGRGIDFPVFATPTISGEVKRHLRDHGWFVRPPRDLQDLRQRTAEATSRLAQELGRTPSIDELAEDLGARAADVREAIDSESHLRPLSLDVTMGDERETTLGDLIPEARDDIAGAERSAELAAALRALPPRDRVVVRLRFYEDRTQQDIAGRVGVTQMQVSRILARSLGVLREHMENGSRAHRAA